MATSNRNNNGCLTAIFQLFGGTTIRRESIPERLPYRVRDNFLSAAELSFYRVLLSVVGNRFVVCTKVRLADIFYVIRPHENLSYFNRISSKHVDFLMCQPDTMVPVLGIELDDVSHQHTNRQKRDELVDSIFKAARLPLLRVPAQRTYDTRDLAARLVHVLRVKQQSAEAKMEMNGHRNRHEKKSPIAMHPNCPKCSSPMVVRTVKKGEHRGKQFYGCPNYPKCRGVLPLREGNALKEDAAQPHM